MNKLTINLLLIGLCINVFSQSKLYLPNFEVIGLHESFQQSASNIFNGYMLKNKKYNVVFDQSVIHDYSIENLQKNAHSKNCDYFIKNNLNALGDLIIVNISLYETETSTLVWSDILKAKSLEDLDPVFYRFSKVIGTENKASDETDIYDVSEYESAELKRYEANSNFGIFIGGAYTFLNNVEHNTSEGFGMILSYDARDYILEARGELFFSEINHYSFNIDILKPLYVRKIHLFLVLELVMAEPRLILRNELPIIIMLITKLILIQVADYFYNCMEGIYSIVIQM